MRSLQCCRGKGTAINGMTLFCFLLFFWVFLVTLRNARAEQVQKPDLIFAYSNRLAIDIDPKDFHAALKIYMEELSRYAGYTTESCLFDNLDTLVRNVQAGRVDVAALSTIDYLKIRNRIRVEPAVAQVRGGRSKHPYLVLVRRGDLSSGISSLKGKRCSVYKGDDVGGLFLNTMLLKREHKEAKAFFASLEEKPKSSQVILSVFFGQADCCVVQESAFKAMCELNPQIKKHLAILVSSQELLPGLSFFRPGLPAYLKEAVFSWAAKLKMHERGRQVLMLFKVEDVVPVQDSDVESVQRLVADYERLKKKNRIHENGKTGW